VSRSAPFASRSGSAGPRRLRRAPRCRGCGRARASLAPPWCSGCGTRSRPRRVRLNRPGLALGDDRAEDEVWRAVEVVLGDGSQDPGLGMSPLLGLVDAPGEIPKSRVPAELERGKEVGLAQGMSVRAKLSGSRRSTARPRPATSTQVQMCLDASRF
jgi:hypothetical protein